MVRNIIIAIIAIILLWLILSWLGVIGGGGETELDEPAEIEEPVEIEPEEPAAD